MAAATGFTVLPAIDVKSGKSVRLSKGDLKQSSSEVDPLEVALEFQQIGAKWIHLVDLDLAFGMGYNTELLTKIVGSVNMKVQVSGGIKDEESFNRALSTGCQRINISCAAIEDFDWLESKLQRNEIEISIALDIDADQVKPRGSKKVVGQLWAILEKLDYAGCNRYSITDVNRDGNLKGPNLELLSSIAQRTNKPLIASGGIASVADLVSLQQISSVDSAIVGKALYTGAMELSDALAVCR